MNICFAGAATLRSNFHVDKSLHNFIKSHDLRIFNLEIKNQDLHTNGSEDPISCFASFSEYLDCFNVGFLVDGTQISRDDQDLQTILSKCNDYAVSIIGAGEKSRNINTYDFGACRIIAIDETDPISKGVKQTAKRVTDDAKRTEKLIKKGRRSGKIIIIISHYKSEQKAAPPHDLRHKYRSWIKSGAELIVGTDSSNVQGHEIFRGKHIFYSLGSFSDHSDGYGSKASDGWGIVLSIDTSNGEINIVPIIRENNLILNSQSNTNLISKYKQLCDLLETPNEIKQPAENHILRPDKIGSTSQTDAIPMAQFALESYSQEGEDMILRRIFENREKGFYVDVGAHHPSRFSNTYFFYKKGWKGINIDAMPGSMAVFNRYRNRDINLEIAVSDREHLLDYYIFNDPALNGFSKNLSDRRSHIPGYKIVEVKKIKTQRLDAILDRHIDGRDEIDFMSIDVEGLDFQALSSNNWSTYRPKVVLVEILKRQLCDLLDDEITIFMKEKGYSLFAKCVHTVFFVDNDFYHSQFMK